MMRLMMILPLALCIIRCVFGVEWPQGTYTLMKPNLGCPENWEEGWRKQDNEDNNNENSITPTNNFAGEFGRNSKFYFCTKDANYIEGCGLWPSGDYCILKQGSTCPSGFNSGSIYWDDEDDNNKNSYGGRMPSGDYDRNTRTHYCCRNDGNYQTQILLPKSRPFFLMRYRGGCQRVYGMEVQEQIVKTDDEDDDNKNSWSGFHPKDSGTNNHQIHYCYYIPTRV